MNPIQQTLAVLLLLGSVLCSGCSEDNPGTWPHDNVSAKVMESLEMTDVTLSPDPAGGFSGTGKRADGEKYPSSTNPRLPFASQLIPWDWASCVTVSVRVPKSWTNPNYRNGMHWQAKQVGHQA